MTSVPRPAAIHWKRTWVTRSAVCLLAALAPIAACTSDGAGPIARPSRVSPSGASASPTPVEPRSVRRVLDFHAPTTRGRSRWVIPYGREPGRIGFADICLPPEACQPPCPCEVPVVPLAFDIDPRGRLWIFDPVVPRLALFSPPSRWELDVPLGRLGRRGLDVQVIDQTVYAAVQDYSFHGRLLRFRLDGRRLRSLPVVFEGEPAELSGRFYVIGDRLFAPTFVGPLADEELFVEMTPRPRGVRAQESEGWPVGGTTLLYPPGGSDATIPLTVVGSTGWAREIEFEFRLLVDDDLLEPQGNVSWGDLEIDPEGALHFLLFAGTYNKRPQDGYWYLKVAPDGTVGRPVKLRDPERDHGGQISRALSLSPSGDPFAMWTDGGGLVIESLRLLEHVSLPRRP